MGIYETCAGSTIDILLSHRLRQIKKQGFKDQAEVSDVAKLGVVKLSYPAQRGVTAKEKIARG